MCVVVILLQTQKRIIKAIPHANQIAFGFMMMNPRSRSSIVVKNAGSATPAMLIVNASKLTTTSTTRNCWGKNVRRKHHQVLDKTI